MKMTILSRSKNDFTFYLDSYLHTFLQKLFWMIIQSLNKGRKWASNILLNNLEIVKTESDV